MKIVKSKEVMKRNIKNDMERSIYLQMPLFGYHHLLYLFYSPSLILTRSLRPEFLWSLSFCFIVLKRNYFISIVSHLSNICMAFVFVIYDGEMLDFKTMLTMQNIKFLTFVVWAFICNLFKYRINLKCCLFYICQFSFMVNRSVTKHLTSLASYM